MLKITITLKSFELCYIKKNVLFLKKICLLLNRKSSTNCSEAVSKPGYAKHSHTIKACNLPKLATDTTCIQDQPANCSQHTTAGRVTQKPEKLGLARPATLNLLGAQVDFLDLNRKDKTGSLRYYVHAYEAYFNFTEVSFPKKKKLFTVLRGPHVDKKSREQFHFITHTKKMSIQCKNRKHVLVFLFILKNAELYGVETQISFCYNSVFKHEKHIDTNYLPVQ